MGVMRVGHQFVAKQCPNITTTITTCKYSFLWLVIEPNYVAIDVGVIVGHMTWYCHLIGQ